MHSVTEYGVAMANKPKPLPWEKIPKEYKRQLYLFVPQDLFWLLGEGREDLGGAVEYIRAGLEEVRRLFDEERLGAKRWLHEQKDAALECYPIEHRRHMEGGTEYLELKSGYDDSRGEQVFKWKGTSISGLLEFITAGESPDWAPPSDERWRRWINWQAARYFFQNEVDGRGVPDGDLIFGSMKFDGPLLVDSMPGGEDRTEKVVRMARALTAPEAEGRERFRTIKALIEELRYYFSESPATLRRDLIRGGYDHPADLTWVRIKRRRK